MGGSIDREKLISHLEKRAQEAYTGAATGVGGMLALYAAFQGTADAIRNGHFDEEKGH